MEILAILSTLWLSQTPPAPEPQEIVVPQQVRPLPGQLDKVPMFNSNSPEVVQKEGILLSTFPPSGRKVPSAHLNFPFEGRFDLFAHHIAKADPAENLRTLYLGVIIHNPTQQSVTVDILQAASYLSQPDAPFIPLPPFQENPTGSIFAGPGDRVMNDILRGQRQSEWPAQLVIGPGESQMLINHPIPVRTLTPPINGRSTLMRLRSTGKVHLASMGMFAPLNSDGSERPPTLSEWQQLLQTSDVAGPRDKTPTPVDQTTGPIIYSRVAGVQQGSVWQAQLTDSTGNLTIPQPGQAFSYALSTLLRGRMGTNQNQSAPLLVRYPDTAYQAHGNYGVQYSLTANLFNPTPRTQIVSLAFQTALKEDELSKNGLRFLEPPAPQTFFRGTVRLRYHDDQGRPQTRYIHLVQRRGQKSDPQVELTMTPASRRLVQLDFLYPPDATPPQVLTISTKP
jgi:hypothetical protein